MIIIAISVVFLLIISILLYKLGKKTSLDTSNIKMYNTEIENLKKQQTELQQDIDNKLSIINNYQNKILEVQSKYTREINKKNSDMDEYFKNQKQIRQSEMDTTFEQLWREKQNSLNLKYFRASQEYDKKIEEARNEAEETISIAKKNQAAIVAETEMQQDRFESLLAPLRQYEKDKQERLYYTIQVPDEYKDDISFLLTTVSQKVAHPDIINKLVWAEYVKPYIDQTFKRVGAEDKPGIYKLTNIDSGKCYIGKSTNVKKRIADHFKSSIGIQTVADQAVHHEILKTGFWNWSIEAITYCDKDKLSELEKYYISFFKSNEFGFNKTGGGEG